MKEGKTTYTGIVIEEVDGKDVALCNKCGCKEFVHSVHIDGAHYAMTGYTCCKCGNAVTVNVNVGIADYVGD